MKLKNIFNGLYLCFFFIVFSISISADDIDRGVIIPETLCQISCELSNGDTYTLGVRTEVILDKHTHPNDHCTLTFTEYAGINGVLAEVTPSKTDAWEITVDKKQGSIGKGYEDDTYFAKEFSFPLFISRSLELGHTVAPFSYPYTFPLSTFIYPLLYRSKVLMEKSEDTITAEYVHEIDTCAFDKQIKIDYECSGSTPEMQWADCNIYDKETEKDVYISCYTDVDCESIETAEEYGAN